MADIASHTLSSFLYMVTGSPHNVVDFEKSYIRVCNLLAGNPNSSNEDSLLRRARVSAVQLRKKRHGPQHEYILVHITLDGRPKYSEATKLGTIKCERMVDNPFHKKPTLRALSSIPGAIFSKSSSSFASLSLSSPSSGTLPAMDQLTLYDPQGHPQELEDDQLVYEYEYPTERAPLPTCLFSAASVLHDKFPDYILLERQCFWFAGMIFRMIVGAAADTLYAPQSARHVRFAIAYRPLESAGKFKPRALFRDPETFIANVPHGAVKVSIGTFQKAFSLVTKEDIEKCFNDVKVAFETRLEEINDRLAKDRAQGMQRARKLEDDTDEKEPWFAADPKEQDDALEALPVLRMKGPAQAQHAINEQLPEMPPALPPRPPPYSACSSILG